MSLHQPSLFASPPRVSDDEGVRVAYALHGDRPVHVGELEHLRRQHRRRPELTCLGCDKRVHAVLPGYGRRPHFRHVERSGDCTAQGGDGARAFNIKAMLLQTLTPPGDVYLTRHCQHARNPWLTTAPLVATAACERTRRRRLPAYASVHLERHPHEGPRRRPDLVLRDLDSAPVFLLFVGLAHSVTHDHERALRRAGLPWLELEVSDQSYPRLAAWQPSAVVSLPWTRLPRNWQWRCPGHRE